MFETTEAACASQTKVQVLDRTQVDAISGLAVRPDASMAGHFFLQPSTEEELLRWAESRPGLIPNPSDPGCRLTQALRQPGTRLRQETCP